MSDREKRRTMAVLLAMRDVGARYWRFDDGWECRDKGSATWWKIASPDEIERLSAEELAAMVRERVEAARAA